MRIILIGFMGTGKSTVGAILARNMHLRLVEVDKLVAIRSGFPSIASLVDAKGEPHFRNIESEVARELSEESDVVISTGGGIIGRPENRLSLVDDKTTVIYLRTSFESISERIGSGEDRPLFRDKEKAYSLYQNRLSTYEQWATIVVDTDGKKPEEIAQMVQERIGII